MSDSVERARQDRRPGDEPRPLDRLEAPYRTFVERMQEGAVELDAEGAIAWCNPFFADLVGRPPADLPGQRLPLLVTPPWRRAVERLVEAAMVRPVHGTCDLEGADRRPVRVLLAFSPLPAADPPRACLVVTDLREQEERRRLEAARQAAEAADFAKDQFLAVLSHELRTPLNAILGWSQLLRATAADGEKVERGLGVIERNARAQAQLIDDLLDISRLVAGKLRLETRPVRLADPVEAAVAAIAPAAEAKGITVGGDLAANWRVMADPDRLQQVIWNLVSNAVKYTSAGGRIDVSVARREGRAEVRVRDTGRGIAAEFLPRLFQLFEQAETGAARRSPGLGLGLALVRRLTELHGGTVGVESEGVGRGATFVVSLPLVDDEGEPAGREETAGADRAADPCADLDLGGLHVLLVEDDVDGLELLSQVLADHGARVHAATSVDAALELLDRHPADLLISDIAMPGRDGFALIREVRDRGRDARDLPAVALTAFAGPEDRRRILLAGYQVHLAKPVDHQDLCAVVASLCGRTG